MPTRDVQLATDWRDLLERHARVTSALQCELEDKHGLGMSEFEVLDRLASSDCSDTPRIQELADQVHLSQSALSRVVARLEKDGLVERKMCDTDRRGIYAHLTDAGRERHAEALPTHRDVLRETLAR
jgi:DNA-binding MarR family transcriptional regulator